MRGKRFPITLSRELERALRGIGRAMSPVGRFLRHALTCETCRRYRRGALIAMAAVVAVYVLERLGGIA